MKLGITVALREELNSLTAQAPKGGGIFTLEDGVSCVLSGMGPANAEKAARELISSGVDNLLGWGCAGALQPDLRPGDLILPDRVVDERAMDYPVNSVWRTRLKGKMGPGIRIWEGRLAGLDHPLRTREEKARWAEKTGAMGVDMESAALARVAREKGVAFLVVRAVSDRLETEIPPWVLDLLDENGFLKRWNFFRNFLFHPFQWGALITLSRQFRAARKTLEEVAELASGTLMGLAN